MFDVLCRRAGRVPGCILAIEKTLGGQALMWSFDPASPEAIAAVDFLESYGAPAPQLIQHPAPVVNFFSSDPSMVENALLMELYTLQDRYTQETVSIYNTAVSNWLLNIPRQPQLPLPPIPQLPALIPPMVELLFGSFGVNASLAAACPPLALRLLRQARIAPGDPAEYTPFPRPVSQTPDLRVIGDETGNPNYFRSGPEDNFPNHYIYKLDGKSYLKLVSPFGTVWMLLP